MTSQLTLQLEPGVESRYRSLLECVAAGVYERGVGRVASLIDSSPSHLSEKLSGGGERNRHLSVDELERYVAETGDVRPVLYLAAKYCRDPEAQRREALNQLGQILPQLQALFVDAGLVNGPARKRR